MIAGTSGPHGQNSLTPADHLLSLESKYPPPKSSAEQKRAKDRAYQLKYRKLHRAKDLIRHAKRRAEQKGVPFDLDDYENEIQARINLGTCELTGFRFNLDCGRTWDSPSLDRINPTEGYVFSNIRVVCHAVNSAMETGGRIPYSDRRWRLWTNAARGRTTSRGIDGAPASEYDYPWFDVVSTTWNEWVTSSGHVIYRAGASGAPHSGSGCTSWPARTGRWREREYAPPAGNKTEMLGRPDTSPGPRPGGPSSRKLEFGNAPGATRREGAEPAHGGSDGGLEDPNATDSITEGRMRETNREHHI
jgi:hypothetical protein